MNFSIIIDWKLVIDLGGSIVAILLVMILDSTTAREVSIHAVDVCKEYAIAVNGTR